MRRHHSEQFIRVEVIMLTYPIDPRELADKRALVTGGSEGIGAAIVRRLSDAGATVASTARRAASDTAAAVFVEADASTAEGVNTIVSRVHERLGGVDIVVHNVGGSTAPAGGFSVLTDDEWQRALSINLLAAVRLDRAFLPGMLERRAGAIVHVTSIQRRLPLFESTLAYAAAKAALANYSKGLSKEVGPKGIRVNAVAPGFMRTQMTQGLESEQLQQIERRSALRHLPDIDDVAHAVDYLLGDKAKSITGAVLTVDAGNSA